MMKRGPLHGDCGSVQLHKDFGFPVVLSWFLLVRMENKLANLTDVIGELSCNIAAMRSDVAKK